MHVRYPDGIIPPTRQPDNTVAKSKKTNYKKIDPVSQPSMKSYTVKPVVKSKHTGYKRHSKYNAHRIYYDHHWFDSKTECGFYIYLKSIHAIFRLHIKYVIRSHHLTPSGIPIRQRTYTPDFIRYKSQKALKENKPYEVDDIKGIGSIPSYDTMRFGGFEDKYDIPVVIIRWQHNHWTRERKCF